MTWPLDARLETAVAGAPVSAAVANALQDAVIHDRGEREIHLVGCGPAGPAVGDWLVVDAGGGGMVAGASTKSMWVPLPLRRGDRIKSWFAYGTKAAGGHEMSGHLRTCNLSTGVVTGGSGATLKKQTTAGALTTIAESGLTQVVGEFDTVSIKFISGDAGDTVNGVVLIIDHP